MATKQDIALMAHLLRRAGFGATRAEIERRADDGYDQTVEWLLSPDEQPEVDEYLLYRYHPDSERPPKVNHASVNWLYRMVNSERPLEEKMGLFWHQVFATGDNKVESAYEIQDQIGMFREHGLGNYPDLLVRLAQNPTMLYWARQPGEPQARAQRELGPRAHGALLLGYRQLHRKGRLRGIPRLYRLGLRHQNPLAPLGPAPVELRVPPREP